MESATRKPASPLRDARKALGLRQTDVAEQARISKSLVCMAEKGLVPGLGSQQRIAAAVGASVGSFW